MTGFGLKYFVRFLNIFTPWFNGSLNGLTRDNGLLVDGKRDTT